MYIGRRALITVVFVLLVVALVAFVAPTTTQGQGLGSVNQQPLNVNVVNTPTVREQAKQPFNQTVQFSIGEGQDLGRADLTVPSGMQLVVTYISGDTTLTAGQTARFSLRAGGSSSDSVLHKLVADEVLPSLATVNEPVQLHLNAGQTLSLLIRRSSSAGVGASTFNVSGYLLSVSQ